MQPKKTCKVEDYLVWTVNEVQLLVETTRDFKVKKGYKRVWLGNCQERIRTDSIDIWTKFPPKSSSEDFQHSAQFFK